MSQGTPTEPTPDAIALLAEALHEYGCMELDGFCPAGLDEQQATLALAHPRLARVVALGLAWVRAEEALPEGWWLEAVEQVGTRLTPEGDRWRALAYDRRASVSGNGPSPEAALLDLIALAEKIGGSK